MALRETEARRQEASDVAGRGRGVSRLANCVRTGVALAKGGMTWSSILLFPIRRRLPRPRGEIALRTGVTDQAPQELADFLASRGFEVELLPPLDVESAYPHAVRRK